MPRFAANLSMMFTEVPFLDRFEAAAKAGFTSVEFLFPYDHPAETVGERLKRNGLTQALFNLPPGNWDAGEELVDHLEGGALACVIAEFVKFRGHRIECRARFGKGGRAA